jgi:hypothetical protein
MERREVGGSNQFASVLFNSQIILLGLVLLREDDEVEIWNKVWFLGS